MTAPYTTERGDELAAFRDQVEDVVGLFPSYWKEGPMNHTLYAAAVRGIIRGDIPTPPSE